jgi:branched-chain amino acid transport system substrate-binding protein
MKSRARRLLNAALGVTAVVTLTVACSSSGKSTTGKSVTDSATNSGTSSDTGGSDAGTGSSATAPTKSTIKIGVETSLTGFVASSYAGVVPTAQAWAKWVNESQGGVNGHPVEIVAKDTKSDAATTLAAATSLTQDSSVLAAIVADSQAESVVAKPFDSAKLPVIGGSSVDSSVWGKDPNYYTTGTVTPFYLDGLLTAAKANGAKKVGVLVCAESPVCQQTIGLLSAGAKAAGVGFVGGTAVSASAANYVAPCLSLKNKGADTMVLLLASATFLRFVADCNGQGYTGSYALAAQTVSQKDFSTLKGFKSVGTIQGFPWWASDAAAQQYRDVTKKYMDSSDYDKQVWGTSSATNVWASLELFRKAMANAPANPTRADVATAYDAVKDETLDGLLPQPLSYSAGQPGPAPNCYWQYKYEDGKFTSLAPSGASGNKLTGDRATECYQTS